MGADFFSQSLSYKTSKVHTAGPSHLKKLDRQSATSTSTRTRHALDVYRCAIEFLALAVKKRKKIQGQLAKGEAEIRDQLRQAALSIPLNIAEALGKVGVNDCACFFAIARGSTMECGAILDCIEILNP